MCVKRVVVVQVFTNPTQRTPAGRMDGLEILEIPSCGKYRKYSARPNAHFITHIIKLESRRGAAKLLRINSGMNMHILSVAMRLYMPTLRASPSQAYGQVAL